MSNQYNFDQIDNDEPTIVMGGVDYKLRSPTVEEIEKIQDLTDPKKRTDAIYDFVYNVNEGEMPFHENLQKQNLKVLTAFTEMIKKEFGVA
jgi:hypothetical protein